jgi:hypothetical protein
MSFIPIDEMKGKKIHHLLGLFLPQLELITELLGPGNPLWGNIHACR